MHNFTFLVYRIPLFVCSYPDCVTIVMCQRARPSVHSFEYTEKINCQQNMQVKMKQDTYERTWPMHYAEKHTSLIY